MIVPIRASSLPHWLDCAARAAAVHLDGKRSPTAGVAALGTAIHASTAVYDRSTLLGDGITPEEAMGAAVDAIYRPAEEVVWTADLQPQRAERVAASLHHAYCRTEAPQHKYLAVELTCNELDVDCGNGVTIKLTGTTDRVEHHAENAIGATDIKTGERAVNMRGEVDTKGHAAQLGVYELLVENTLSPITAPARIIGMNTGTPRIGVGEVRGAREALIGTKDEPGVFDGLALMLKAGVFLGNPRSLMCSNVYCPIYNACRFRR